MLENRAESTITPFRKAGVMVRVAYAWLMRAYPGLQVVRCAGAGRRA
jgi:hypothetical protein